MFFSLTKNSRDSVFKKLPQGDAPSVSKIARDARDGLSVREMNPYLMRAIYFELHSRIFGSAPWRVDESKLETCLGRAMSWCIKNEVDFPTFVAAQMDAMRFWFESPKCKYKVFMPAMLTSNNAIRRFVACMARGNWNRRDALDGLECFRAVGVVRIHLVTTEFEVGKTLLRMRQTNRNAVQSDAVEYVKRRGLLEDAWLVAHRLGASSESEEVMRSMFTRERLEQEKRSAFLQAAESVLRSYRNNLPDLIGSDTTDFSWTDVFNLVTAVAPPSRTAPTPTTDGLAGRFLWRKS
jgi:hypothetical protein